MDDVLTCETYVTKLGKVRINWTTDIKRGDELMATVNVEMVCVSLEQQRPSELPPEVYAFCKNLVFEAVVG